MIVCLEKRLNPRLGKKTQKNPFSGTPLAKIATKFGWL